MSVRISAIVWLCFSLWMGGLSAAYADERATARRFETAKVDEPSLIAFVKAMPKGADLHVHVAGAAYAEYALDSAIAPAVQGRIDTLLEIQPVDQGSQ